jgi:hypothetical protein
MEGPHGERAIVARAPIARRAPGTSAIIGRRGPDRKRQLPIPARLPIDILLAPLPEPYSLPGLGAFFGSRDTIFCRRRVC